MTTKKPITVVVPATDSDVAQLHRVDALGANRSKSRKWFTLQASDPATIIYVAKQGNTGRIVGYILLYDRETSAVLTRICVDPMYRRQGIGTQLFFQMMAEKPEQLMVIKADVPETDLQLQMFCKALGFHCVSIKEGKETKYCFEYGIGAEC